MTIAANIRATVKSGPLPREQVITGSGLSRKRAVQELGRQIGLGLLVEVDGQIDVGRLAYRENLFERAARAKAYRDRQNAARRAKRALKPKRALLTPEEKEARRVLYDARRNEKARESRAARLGPPRPKLTPEQRAENRRERQRAWYAQNAERLLLKRRVPEEVQTARRMKREALAVKAAKSNKSGPAVKDSARSRPIDLSPHRIHQRGESYEQYIARGGRVEVCPAPTFSLPRLLPRQGRWIGARAA